MKYSISIIFILLAINVSIAETNFYDSIKPKETTVYQLLEMCGQPMKSKGPSMNDVNRIYQYKNFTVILDRKKEVVEFVQIFDKNYQDAFGISIGDPRDKVYKTHNITSPRYDEKSEKSFFVNITKNPGFIKVPNKKVDYYFNKDKVSIIQLR